MAAREATAAEPKPGDKRPAGWDVASMAPKQKVRWLLCSALISNGAGVLGCRPR